MHRSRRKVGEGVDQVFGARNRSAISAGQHLLPILRFAQLVPFLQHFELCRSIPGERIEQHVVGGIPPKSAGLVIVVLLLHRAGQLLQSWSGVHLAAGDALPPGIDLGPAHRHAQRRVLVPFRQVDGIALLAGHIDQAGHVDVAGRAPAGAVPPGRPVLVGVGVEADPARVPRPAHRFGACLAPPGVGFLLELGFGKGGLGPLLRTVTADGHDGRYYNVLHTSSSM